MDYNNLRQFMDTQRLSSKQVYLAKKILRYYFRIDYCQGKVNGVADTFSQYFQ